MALFKRHSNQRIVWGRKKIEVYISSYFPARKKYWVQSCWSTDIGVFLSRSELNKKIAACRKDTRR